MEKKIIDFDIKYNKINGIKWYDCEDLPGWYCMTNNYEELHKSLVNFIFREHGDTLQKVELSGEGKNDRFYICEYIGHGN